MQLGVGMSTGLPVIVVFDVQFARIFGERTVFRKDRRAFSTRIQEMDIDKNNRSPRMTANAEISRP